MEEFNAISGELYYLPDENDFEPEKEVASEILFISGTFEIRFTADYYLDIPSEDEYVPEDSELRIEVANMYDLSEYVFFDDVTIDVRMADNGLYVKTEFEQDLYGYSRFFGPDNKLYRVDKISLSGPEKSNYPGNDFLGVDSFEDAVLITECKSGVCVPMQRDRFDELVENNNEYEIHGAVKVFGMDCNEHLEEFLRQQLY